MNTAARNILNGAALVALCLTLAARAEEKPAASVKAVCVAPKSVFANQATAGVDPFFPNSRRRLDALPRVALTNLVVQSSTIWDRVKLQGVSGPEGQRLALVSGATVAVGEVAEIKNEGQIVRIRCREIRDRSVIMELVSSGETRELKLRDNI